MAKTDEAFKNHQETDSEMPKGGKKGKKRQGLLCISDITLNDFADCPRPQSCGRVKKYVASTAVVGAITKASSAQTVLEKEDEDLSWFEKDLENFVIEDPIDEDDGSDVQTIQANLDSKVKKSHEKITSGITYPQDLWFLVSEYIHPEDIGAFSRTCHGAHAVTLTVTFWRQLYNRLNVKVKDSLPTHLRPQSMERLHGMRARVIRSLFFLCPTLISRVQSRGPMEDEPHCLRGHRCLLAWHQPATKGWQFCFKFKKPSLKTLISHRPVTKLDVYHGYNDIFYNPEEGCSVLQVTCCHFASVATVMGLLLNQVYVTLSNGFRHHRLRLHFDSSASASQNASDTVVVLDDVISIKLMRWWHPGYPFIS